MTLEEEYQLSCYEEVTRLHEKKEIYLVRHNLTGELCVKKKLSVYNGTVYRKLQQMHVSQIPKIHVCIEDENQLILIEEYIHGKTLKEHLDEEGVLKEPVAIVKMLELCDILESLHNCEPPMIHRDIKPSNIMVSMDGVLKLIDFNATKEYDSEKSVDTFFMGTIDYAAPEQYGFGQSDPRTDIYGCGIMLNMLLTGTFPRERLYDGAVGNVIGRCVSIDPKERYQSVMELRIDLQKVLSLQAEYVSTRKKNPNSFRESYVFRRLAGVMIAILCVGVIGIGGGLLLKQPKEEKDSNKNTFTYKNEELEGAKDTVEDEPVIDEEEEQDKAVDAGAEEKTTIGSDAVATYISVPVKLINYSGHHVSSIYPREDGTSERKESIIDEMTPSGYTSTGDFWFMRKQECLYDFDVEVMDALNRREVIQWTTENVDISDFTIEGITVVLYDENMYMYHSEDYVLPGSDYYYVTSGVMDDLTTEQARLARYEIYARHGVIFEDTGLQAYFESKAWYEGKVPEDEFMDSTLSAAEKANITNLEGYENGGPIGV